MCKIAETPNSQEAQIKAYEVSLKETDQVIAIQNHTATVANLLLVITGAVWAALHAKELAIPPPAAAMMLLLHILACLAVLQLLISNTHAIKLRFAFLQEYGTQYYRDIQNIGRNAFSKTYGSAVSTRAKYFRWADAKLCGTLYQSQEHVGSFYLVVPRFAALLAAIPKTLDE